MKKLIIALALGAVSLHAAAADIRRGEQLAKTNNCANCHGVDYNKPSDPIYPKLAGQHADYITHALTAYKRGADKPNGRGNPIMMEQVKPLTDQDMVDIGAYLASLPSSLVIRK